MIYGDAPYASRPYADIEFIVGFADSALDASATFKYVIYSATRTFALNFDDSVAPNRPYDGTLMVPINIKRTMLSGSEIGGFSQADGDSVLNNEDGRYDSLPQTFTANGRPIEIKAFRRGDDLADAFTVFKGVMRSWFINESQVAIKVMDFGYKLKVPALPNVYAGTGGAEGAEDIAGKRKPRGTGKPRNVAAVLVNAQYLVFQPHDGEVEDIPAVYDRGVGLTQGADYPSYAALIAATIGASGYVTCLALGLFRLGSSPAGQVTADYDTGIHTTADAVRYWVEEGTDLVYADDFYAPAFEKLNTDQPAPIDVWLGLDASVTVADMCAFLARGAGGWSGFRRNGLLEICRFVAPAGASVGAFGRVDILSIKREPLPSNLAPPPKRYRARWGWNFTAQTDLADGVSADRKSFAANAFRLASTPDADAVSIGADYPDAQDPEPLPTYFREEADALAEAQRQLDRDRVERALYRCELPRRALYQNLGEQLELEYPRWDLSAGADGIVVDMTENIQPPRDGAVDSIEVVIYA